VKTEHFSVTTTFHQWNKELEFEVCDLFGRRIISRIIDPTDKILDLYVSAWPRGLCFFRLSYREKTVAAEPDIIE
jgi:hypothetical protein